MKSNDCTNIIAISDILINLLNEKASNKESEEITENDYQEKLNTVLCEFCEPKRTNNPEKTIKNLDELLLKYGKSPDDYFIERYVHCLATSCYSQDEIYAQNAVNMIKQILDMPQYSKSISILINYIKTISALSIKQEPVKAMQTIKNLKATVDEADTWEYIDNFYYFCLALEHLCYKQSKSGDLQGAYETLEIIKSIIRNIEFDDDDEECDEEDEDIDYYILEMVKCYTIALAALCKNDDVSLLETYNMIEKIEDLLIKTQNMENDRIALEYMISLRYLGQKQLKHGQSITKTIKRARLITENNNYGNQDELIAWYTLLLVDLVNTTSPEDLKSTHKRLSDITSKPHFINNEVIHNVFNHVKQHYGNEEIA